MNHTEPVTKKLFIEELERPVPAGEATTLAIGEECGYGFGQLKKGEVTTLALGEEAGA